MFLYLCLCVLCVFQKEKQCHIVAVGYGHKVNDTQLNEVAEDNVFLLRKIDLTNPSRRNRATRKIKKLVCGKWTLIYRHFLRTLCVVQGLFVFVFVFVVVVVVAVVVSLSTSTV